MTKKPTIKEAPSDRPAPAPAPEIIAPDEEDQDDSN